VTEARGSARALGRFVDALRGEEERHATLRIHVRECKKSFELTMSISEREKGKAKCPTCKGTKVTPQLGGFMGQTAKKS
jgi:hypothetical protein